MAIIKVNSLYKSFGIKKVLEGVSFEVREGECLGLIGGSGTGKSVLLRSLIGLEVPDSGTIEIHDFSVTTLKEHKMIELRKKVAYVFQGGALFDSMTVYENLAYPLREHTHFSEEEISEMIYKKLKNFNLEGNAKIFPANLSGGMQKRVGLARAIILNPEIILYDEPTAGLDPFNNKTITEMIINLKKTGVTSILVTHDMSSVFSICDRIAMISKGHIGDIKTVEELKNDSKHIIHKFIQGEVV